jgi:hypothetical protein
LHSRDRFQLDLLPLQHSGHLRDGNCGCLIVSRGVTFALILAFAFAALFIGVFVFHPVYVTVCEFSEHGTSKNCEQYHVLLAVLRKVGQVLSLAETWTALATIAIAAFTYALKRATDRLWDANERQIRLAREEFISTNRPKLIVRQFVLQPPVVNDVLKVDFSIFNVGNTEATVRLLAAEVALWNGRFWEAPGIDPNVRPFGPRVVRNGERISVTIMSRFNLTATQLTAIRQGTFIICAVGEFTYTDALDTKRRSGFRRNHDVATDTFTTSTNPDQEYQD